MGDQMRITVSWWTSVSCVVCCCYMFGHGGVGRGIRYQLGRPHFPRPRPRPRPPCRRPKVCHEWHLGEGKR